MGNTSRHEQRRLVRSLTIVAMVAIFLWTTSGDNTGVAAFKIKFDPYRIFGPEGRAIINRLWLNIIGRGYRFNSPNNGIYGGQGCRYPCSRSCGIPAGWEVVPYAPRSTCLDGVPCDRSLCGRNAFFRNDECVCRAGTTGKPRNGCHYPANYCNADTACRNDRAYIGHKCGNPCTDKPCGFSAECAVRNHEIMCDCPLGFTGDPYVKCEQDKPTLLPGHCVDVEKEVESLKAAIEEDSKESLPVILNFFSRCTVVERSKILDAYHDKHRKALSAEILNLYVKNNIECKEFRFFHAHNFTDYLVTILSFMHTHLGVTSFWNDYQTYLTPLTDDNESTIRSIRFNDSDFYWATRKELFDSTSPDVIHWNIVESQLMSRRSGPTAVDRTRAIEDAKEIQRAIESGNWRQDDSVFHYIMLTTSYPQLREVLKQYELLGRKPLEKEITETFTPNAANAFIDILQYAKNKTVFFAQKLKWHLGECKKNPLYLSTFIATIFWRSEIDLGNIKETFLDLYGVVPLESSSWTTSTASCHTKLTQPTEKQNP